MLACKIGWTRRILPVEERDAGAKLVVVRDDRERLNDLARLKSEMLGQSWLLIDSLNGNTVQ